MMADAAAGTASADTLLDQLNAIPGDRKIARCCLHDGNSLEKINKASSMTRVRVTFCQGENEREASKVDGVIGENGEMMMLKLSDGGGKKHGLAREGIFYSEWSSLVSRDAYSCISAILPRIFRSTGDMAASTKIILMEDLAAQGAIDLGYLFGPLNPNNWGKDIDSRIQSGFNLTPAQATDMAFSAIASVHAATWGKAQSIPWLHGAAWFEGKDRELWEDSQRSVKSMWEAMKQNIARGTCKVTVRDELVTCLDAAVAKANWDTFQSEIAARPYCLTHGDFHPANIMVRPKNSSGQHSVAIFDWECVGIGSGPQDLGQFMISHTEPATRAAIERASVEKYYQKLKGLNPSIEMTMSQCWEEYIAGGLGRWLWFIPLLVDMCPPKMGQFFVDQVTHFIETHGIVADNTPMPRA